MCVGVLCVVGWEFLGGWGWGGAFWILCVCPLEQVISFGFESVRAW